MLALLAGLRGAGRTIVLTTHQRELAEPMADDVLDEAGADSMAERQRDPERRMKTNAARILDGLGIAYTLQEYEVDPEDLRATRGGEDRHAAEQVFKTLLCAVGGGEYVFAVVPGDAELDFKKLARAAGVRKAEMASLKDVQPLTGYIRGGVTVFGAKKAFPRSPMRRSSSSTWSRSRPGSAVSDRALSGGLSARDRRDGRRPDQGARPGAIVLLSAGPSAKGPAHRVAREGRDAVDAVLRAAGRRALLAGVRSDAETSRQYAGGVMCVAVLFAAVQALNQAWSRELRGNVLDAQRMTPAPASALYLAKVLANFIFVLIVEEC